MAYDARNRLRSMGGIMASSPELMQAAQRFNLGGVAMASPLLDTTDEARAARGFARSAYMSGLQGPPRRDVVADLINTSNATPFQEDIVANLLDTTDEARAARGFARSAYMSGLQGPVVDIPEDKSLYSTVQEDKAVVLAEKEAELEELIKNRKNPDIPSSSADKDNQKRLEDTIRRLEKNPEIQATREEELMSMPLKPELLTQEQIDRAMAIAQKDPFFAVPKDGAAEDVDTTEDVDTAADDDTPAPAPKPSKKDLRGRYEETIALFKEIFGEDDNDQARDRAMSLAMIGLAIAAGQSPNALTNVARGLMAGVQGIAKRREDKRERERGLRSAALEAALAQEAAATEAEREAAQSQLEFERELDLERLKAQLEEMYGTGSRDPRSIIDFAQNAYSDAFKAASEGSAPDYDSKTETPHDYAMRLARRAARSMQEMYPNYGQQIGQTGGEGSATIPTVITPEDFDALPSGVDQQFYQYVDGKLELRRKP